MKHNICIGWRVQVPFFSGSPLLESKVFKNITGETFHPITTLRAFVTMNMKSEKTSLLGCYYVCHFEISDSAYYKGRLGHPLGHKKSLGTSVLNVRSDEDHLISQAISII